MILNHLTDSQLNLDLKNLVQKERELLTSILYHLKEMEVRKLYSSLGYTSLFDYSCKELKYSSDQAYRRIQAMRLLKDIPEISKKIDSGELSLSNISQAQKYFKDTKINSKCDKVKVLKTLLNKSVRDGQKELLKLNQNKYVDTLLTSSQKNITDISLPKEIKKQITPTHMQISFNMSEALETKLNEIKTLLGPKAYNLSMSELIEYMANLAKEKLMENMFGKKIAKEHISKVHLTNEKECANEVHLTNEKECANEVHLTNEKESTRKIQQSTLNVQSNVASRNQNSTSSRYISKKLKYFIWQKANMECECCGSKVNLHIDHIKPFALGGETKQSNLRLLCFNCNYRKAINAKLF